MSVSERFHNLSLLFVIRFVILQWLLSLGLLLWMRRRFLMRMKVKVMMI